jgi:WhiB family redox-sensing transcriptional regulator
MWEGQTQGLAGRLLETKGGGMSHPPDRPRTEDNETPTSWMAHARCRDVPPEVFFPSDGAGVEVAQRYCAECPVASQCLEYALENHIEHGVWGGTSERKRRRIKQSRRANADRARTGLPLASRAARGLMGR